MATSKRLSEETIRFRFSLMIQAWEILISRAKRRECISYTDLSTEMFGKPIPRSRRMMLGQILTFCRKSGFPELSVIVVTKGSKRPAEGAPYDAGSITAKQRDVFGWDWDKADRPVESDFQSY